MAVRPYSELGKVIDQLARARDVRGPNAIAAYVKERTGAAPGRSAWHKILYGDINPSRETMRRFAVAFELDEEETKQLAVMYIFDE
jgi:hypothetical protein